MNSHAATVLATPFDKALQSAQRSMIEVIHENVQLRAENETLRAELAKQSTKLERLALSVGINRRLEDSCEARHVM